MAAVLGFLSGLGVGGGSLLILYLTVVLQMAPSEARDINLLFFLPCALIATLFRWRQGAVDLKTIWPVMVTGCAAAFLFSRLSLHMETGLLKKLFGCLLILTGLRELVYKKRKARS